MFNDFDSSSLVGQEKLRVPFVVVWVSSWPWLSISSCYVICVFGSVVLSGISEAPY